MIHIQYVYPTCSDFGGINEYVPLIWHDFYMWYRLAVVTTFSLSETFVSFSYRFRENQVKNNAGVEKPRLFLRSFSAFLLEFPDADEERSARDASAREDVRRWWIRLRRWEHKATERGVILYRRLTCVLGGHEPSGFPIT